VTVETDNKADALAVAALLERWADEIPRWDATTGERWDEFADRRFEAERILKERLRRLPTCVLRTDEACAHVELMLAGIKVNSQACLGKGCRAWAEEMKRRTMQ
jgi:hypothetical protein